MNWLFPQNWISNVDEYLQSFHIHHHSTHSMSIPWYLYIFHEQNSSYWSISHESPMKSPMFLGCPPLPKKALRWPSRWPSAFFPSAVRWETFLGPGPSGWGPVWLLSMDCFPKLALGWSGCYGLDFYAIFFREAWHKTWWSFPSLGPILWLL